MLELYWSFKLFINFCILSFNGWGTCYTGFITWGCYFNSGCNAYIFCCYFGLCWLL